MRDREAPQTIRRDAALARAARRIARTLAEIERARLQRIARALDRSAEEAASHGPHWRYEIDA